MDDLADCFGRQGRLPLYRNAVRTILPLLAAILLPWPAHAQGPAAQAPAAAFQKLPLVFEANTGQIDPAVKFLSRGSGYTLFLTADEAVLALIKAPGDGTVLRMTLVGAQPSPRIAGLEELPGKVNYFIGNDPTKWRTNIPTYARVKYQGVYPGVDLVYYGDGRQLEYDFIVAPGTDPKAIALAFEGPDKLDVDAQGDLVIQTAGGELRLRKPFVYQVIDGQRKPLAGNYILKAKNRVGFQVAAYDASKPLVIDPVLIYSTYLGGGGTDIARGIAADLATSGTVYVTGDTISANFPTKAQSPAVTPYQSTLSKSTTTDCFITKIDTTVGGSSSLKYSTYLGGSSNDQCFGIAVNSSGNAYVTGQTSSTNFPGSALSKAKGSGDIFVVKLNSTGSALVYSAFLGGSSADAAFAIAVDSANQAYVTGKTTSKDFPVIGGFQPSPGVTGGDPSGDAFVTKLNAAGTAILYSTYLGGNAADEGRGIAVGIAVGDAGRAYVTGTTSSTSGFPLTGGALDNSLGGPSDAFVTKVNTTLSGGASLVYSTYLGGGCAEQGRAIAVDALGSAYVTGQTFSTDFPGAAGFGFQLILGEPGMTCGASGDAFVAKLNAAGSALSYSTYLGGALVDVGLGVAVDGSGNAYVTGQTFSTDFPTPGGFDTGLGGPSDAFVTRINTNTTGSPSLVYSTLLGGTGGESASGIALDTSSYVYVTGQTSSTNLLTAPGGDPPTVLGFQTCLGSGLGGPCQTSGTDAFVAKLSNNSPPVLTSPGNKTIAEGSTLSFTLSASDPDAGQTRTFSISGGVQSGMSLVPSTGAFSWTPTEAQGAGTYSVTFRATDNGTPPLFDEKTITITVTEVNSAPVLSGVPPSVTIDEMVLYTFTATATDSDIPTQTLTFSLVGAPSGAAIVPSTGVFTWTPNETQGPGIYSFTVRVSDGVANTDASITITVNEVNVAPVLGAIGNQSVAEGTLLTFTATATDADRPANTLTFSLANGTTSCGGAIICTVPAGANIINSTGVFTWTPIEAQGPGTYRFKVIVTDNGTPNLSASEEITVTVSEVNTAPVLGAIGNQSVNEGALLEFPVSATDADFPANTLTFSASNLPLGATFDPVTRTFSWRPTSAQGGPSPYLVDFTVSDGQFSDTRRLSITVFDTIADRDGDGVPDVSDNCPDHYNPDQADVCHNSPEAVTGEATALPLPPTGPINVTATFTFTTQTEGTSVVPPNRFNVICRVTSNATLQELEWQTVPEGVPIVLSNFPDGDLIPLPVGSTTFVTTFDLRDWYPNLPEGSYTVVCTYVNFAHIPGGPEPGDPTTIWMGEANAPPFTVFIGGYAIDSPFFLSPAENQPFNRPRTVPVKFELRDSTGALVTTATIRLFVQRLVNGVLVGDPIPATSNESAGNVVTFDPAANQYHYNLKTEPLAIGFWQIQAQLDDGTTQVITIEIR